MNTFRVQEYVCVCALPLSLSVYMYMFCVCVLGERGRDRWINGAETEKETGEKNRMCCFRPAFMIGLQLGSLRN